MTKRREIYHIREIMDVARSLMPEPDTDMGDTEYARGICELIGRLQLDVGGHGEGTGENALKVASCLNVGISSTKGYIK